MDDLVNACSLKNDPKVRELLLTSVIGSSPPDMKLAGMTGRFASLRYTFPHRLDAVHDIPTGIRQLLSGGTDDVVVKLADSETYPDRKTAVDDETYASLSPVFQGGPHVTNPFFVASIQEAKICNSRLWNREGDLIVESLTLPQANVTADRLREQHIVYKSVQPRLLYRMLRRPADFVMIPDCCVLLDNERNRNYAHWHLQMLAAYSMLRDAIASEGLKILVSMSSGFQRESLSMAGIPDESVIFMQPDTTYRVSRLLFPSYIWLFRSNMYLLPRRALEIFDAIRNSAAPSAGGSGRRIYVARFGVKARRLENERELADRLSGLGFDIIVGEALSFDEQVKVFSEAAVVVGTHGAGLTNCVYCRPGTTVIELAHREFLARTVADTRVAPLPEQHATSIADASNQVPLATPQIRSKGYSHLFAARHLNGVLYLEHAGSNFTLSSYARAGVPIFTWRIDIDKAVSFITRFTR